MSALAPILQGFFTDKLIRQRRAGPNTLSAYRDTWRLLLQFASHTTATAPSGLDLAQIDAELVTAFLTHLETERANTAATRNARLAAIRSLFRYAALHSPEHAEDISRVLAIPPKRCDRPVVCFLTAAEIDARPRPAAARLPNRAAGLRADRVDPQRHSPRPPRRACPM